LFSSALSAAIAAHGSVGGPPAPRIADCKSSSSSLSVSWESKFAAVGTPVFSVELKAANDEKAVFVEAYQGSELKAECGNLQLDTAYVVRVRVRDDRGWSKWSDEATLRTEAFKGSFPESKLLNLAQDKQLS